MLPNIAKQDQIKKKETMLLPFTSEKAISSIQVKTQSKEWYETKSSDIYRKRWLTVTWVNRWISAFPHTHLVKAPIP